MQENRKTLHDQLGSLGQRYMIFLVDGDKDNAIDNVYGVYFDNNAR